MKTIILSCLLVVLGGVLSAQTPEWQWAVRAGGPALDESEVGQAIAIDGQGNQYVTGWFWGTATFGPYTLTSASSEYPDIFAVKLDTNGNWLWAVQAVGGAIWGYGFGQGIAVDGDDNVYLTGYFEGTADFGTTYLTSVVGVDAYVAKLDTSGNWLWAVRGGGTDNDFGQGIAVDGAGNAYLTGFFSGSADFGPYTLTSSGYEDVFAAKLDPNGNWLWAVRAGGLDYDYGYGIAVDNTGNAYLTGYFWGSATFGPYTLTSSYIDIFAAKMDPNGNWLWAVRAGGTSWDEVSGIAVDGTGNAYLTGYFEGSAVFGSYTITSSVDGDIFAAKLDPNGNWLWAVRAGGASHDDGYGIAVDGAGNAGLTGYCCDSATFGPFTLTEGGLFAAKIDASGNWLWAVQGGGTGYSIAMDQAGNAYLTGSFSGSASFGPYTITSSGYDDIFVAKLSPGTPVEDELNPPVAPFVLSARPNPFNPETTIAYTLPSAGSVFLEIYNSRGQIVRSLLQEEQPAGEHSLIWNGKDDFGNSVASGLYLCRIDCNGKHETRKMLLIK